MRPSTLTPKRLRNPAQPKRQRPLLVTSTLIGFAFMALGFGESAEAAVHHRVNAGGPAVDGNGDGDILDVEDWKIDTADSPSQFLVPSQNNQISAGICTDLDLTVPDPVTCQIFQDKRLNPLGLDWQFPVEAGKAILVQLFFAESYFTEVGQRKFDASIDGVMTLPAFDITLAAGGSQLGHMEEFLIVSDGMVDIHFGSTPLVGLIDAIAIVDAPATNTLAVWPSANQKLSFGDVELLQTGTSSVRVANRGGTQINLTGATISGVDAADFEVEAAFPIQLVAGLSVALPVEFSPSLMGYKEATITLSHSGGSTVIPVRGFGHTSDEIDFASFELQGGPTIASPTSLQFGPDGRLYVAELGGLIRVLTISEIATGYQVTASETINSIQQIPNHDDATGALNATVQGRTVLGLLVVGTAANQEIFVSSSDPRLAAPFDTNSGMVSKLTKMGSGWQRQDLVRGLPRAAAGHALAGMQLDAATNTLYLAVAGNTNQGAPSSHIFFAHLPEYALTSALLAIDLDLICTPSCTTYDLPTLDDDSRRGSVDANDPFGGNHGKNQAKLVANGPVQVFGSGFRNIYDVLLTSQNRIYASDNGPNPGYGDVPIDCTNAESSGGSFRLDNLHWVTAGSHGGHPNPARGNPSIAWNRDMVPPAPEPADPRECQYRAPGQDGALAFFFGSTNGIAEYRSTAFDGSMFGDILVTTFGSGLWRLRFDHSGNEVVERQLLFTNSAYQNMLDVTVREDGDAFPGTIWIAENSESKILVLKPSPLANCTPTESDKVDSDGDEYKDFDEFMNGTGRCSAAQTPPDFDHDFRSDLLDPDDDQDGLSDKVDLFALDSENGTAIGFPTPISLEFASQAAGGLLGSGFTGLMNNGKNYLDMLDPQKVKVGDAAGILRLIEVPAGDSVDNNQRNGFQLGYLHPVESRSATYTVQTKFVLSPEMGQEQGLFLGTGTQDDYVRVTYKGLIGFEFEIKVDGEIDGVPAEVQRISIYPPPPSNTTIEVFLSVSRATFLRPAYRIGNGPIVSLPERALPEEWRQNGVLALGLIASRNSSSDEFNAFWDFFRVYPGYPSSTPPVAGNDAATLEPGTGIEIDILANDADPSFDSTASLGPGAAELR